jgi:hypothetical protein
MKSKIKSLNKVRQHEIGAICERVLETMANNKPYFPTLPQEYEELKIAWPKYHTSLAEARGRDSIKVSVKNDEKANVLRLLTAIADYVTLTAKGDRTILLKSGFDVTGTIVSETPELAIEMMEVVLGEPGVATTQIKKATAAIAFVHEYATEVPGPNTAWTSEGTSQDAYTFKGLSSDKRYWFRVVAIGKNGQRVYSAVVSRVIQ